MAAIWILVIRHQPALVPLVTAAGTILAAAHDTLTDAFPGAALGSAVGAVLVAAAAVWWYRRLAAGGEIRTEEP